MIKLSFKHMSTKLLLSVLILGTVTVAFLYADYFFLPLQLAYKILPILLGIIIYWQFGNSNLENKTNTIKRISWLSYIKLIIIWQILFYLITIWLLAVLLLGKTIQPVNNILIQQDITAATYLPYIMLAWLLAITCAVYKLYAVLYNNKAPYLIAIICNKPKKQLWQLCHNIFDFVETRSKFIVAVIIFTMILWQSTLAISELMFGKSLNLLSWLILVIVLNFLIKDQSYNIVDWLVNKKYSLGRIWLIIIGLLICLIWLLLVFGEGIYLLFFARLPFELPIINAIDIKHATAIIDPTMLIIRFKILFFSWLLILMPKLISCLARYSYGFQVKQILGINLLISLIIYSVFALIFPGLWSKLLVSLDLPIYRLGFSAGAAGILWFATSYIYTLTDLWAGPMGYFYVAGKSNYPEHYLAGERIAIIIRRSLPVIIFCLINLVFSGWVMLLSCCLAMAIVLLPEIYWLIAKIVFHFTKQQFRFYNSKIASHD